MSQSKNPDETRNVKKVRVWQFMVEEYEDGESTLFRLNDGFNQYELLGMLETTLDDIKAQIKGQFKPDKVIRQVVIEGCPWSFDEYNPDWIECQNCERNCPHKK